MFQAQIDHKYYILFVGAKKPNSHTFFFIFQFE